MLEKLKAIEEKYVDIENRMQDPEVYSDPAAYAKLAKEQKELTPLVEAYRQYAKCVSDAEGALAFLMAGCTAVQVGAMTFARPNTMIEIIDGLEAYCEQEGLKNISEICGIL